jgi:hypothetical protein
MLDQRQRSLLLRLVQEGAWVRAAKREAAVTGYADFVAVQVLAAVGLDASLTFDGAQSKLGITKSQLSRAVGSLRRDRLIAEPTGRYARSVLPPITDDGLAYLRELAGRLAPH